MPVGRGLRYYALVAFVAAVLAACGGDPPESPATRTSTPSPVAATPTPTRSATTAPAPTGTAPAPTGTATPVPTDTATPVPTATATSTPAATPAPSPAATPSPTPSVTPTPTEYVPLTMGEPRPLPPGATLYFRQYDSCHGPVWWRRAVATEAGDLAWDNPFAELPAVNADEWGPENWPPQLARLSASGQTLVARVCERGACMAFDHVDEDAVEALWGSVDAGESWERWGDDPEGGIRGVSEEDVAFVDTDGRVKGVRSGEEWVPPENPPSPWVRSEVDDRLGYEEREPGQLDTFRHYSDQGAILGAYSWGGDGSYESHRPLWLVDHLKGQLFVGFLGSHACGAGTKTVLVDFGSRTVHTIPGLDPEVDHIGNPILYTARLTPIPILGSEPRPALAPSPTFAGPPDTYADIAVAYSGACGLTEEGEAVCWDIESGDVWDAPPGRYTFITANHSNWCATTDEGVITCWGKGGGPVPEDDPDPSREAPSGRFSALSFTIAGVTRDGASYACALTEEGEPVCWGPEDGLLPLPDLPAGVYSAISLDLYWVGESGYFTAILTACAIADGGDLVCWRGTNNDGRVEQAVEHSPGNYVDAQVVESNTCVVTAGGEAKCAGWAGDGSTRYTGLAAGREFACAITEAGAIQCVDHGLYRVSIGGDSGRSSVMQPPTPTPGRRYETVSVSSPGFATYACALTDSGEADCWRSTDNKVAYPDPPPGRYVAVSDGFGHTCALTEDGQVLCWGWNNYGQVAVPEGRYTAVSAGFASTCALNEAGEAVCWGRSLGSVPSTPPSQERYRAISTGYYGGCVLTLQGRPVCPGWQPLPEAPPTSFTSLVVSWTGHACALSKSGEADCWGGDARVEVDLPPGSWKAIDVGDFQTCGIDDAGRAICWGAHSGQLPDAPTGSYVAVETSGYDVCLLTDAGQVYCRGEEDWGNGVALRRLDVEARVLEVSVGLHRGCALTEAGSVICWGDTEYQNAPFLNRHGYQPRW